MNILLNGFGGKMGGFVKRELEGAEDMTLAAGVDAFFNGETDFKAYKSFDEVEGRYDCIIDFSHPNCIDSMLSYIEKTKTPAVICTTGLSKEQIDKINELSKSVPVFFSANMSLGVNLIVDLCKKAAALLDGNFDIEIIEKHHNLKVDAPSGTALMLANAINSELDNKFEYVYDRQSVRKKREKTEIGMHSVRGGNIVGEHEVIFAGHDECISIKHQATSKEVFAVGAVKAARFLASQKAGMYQMSDMLK